MTGRVWRREIVTIRRVRGSFQSWISEETEHDKILKLFRTSWAAAWHEEKGGRSGGDQSLHTQIADYTRAKEKRREGQSRPLWCLKSETRPAASEGAFGPLL